MSEFSMFTTFSVFITLYFIFMVPMGGAEAFGVDVNITEDELTRQPDMDTGPIELDFMDAYESSNVVIVDTDNYFNGSQDWNTDRAVVLDNQSERGYMSFNVPNSREVTTLTQKESIFVDTRTHLWEGNITDESCSNANTCTPLRGESDVRIAEDTSFVTVEFQKESSSVLDSENPVLYSIEYSEDLDPGWIGTVFGWFDSAFSYIGSLYAITSALPIYMRIPFALYLGFLSVKALSLL